MSYPFRLESEHPLDLPPICVCCGKETHRTTVLPAEVPGAKRDTAILGVIGIFFPMAHIAAGVAELKKKKVRIPYCWRCHLNYILPAPKLRVPLCGFVLLLAATLYILIVRENLTLGFGGAACCSVLLFVIGFKNTSHEARCLPIQVHFEQGRYLYSFRSGPFLKFFQDYPNADLEFLRQNIITRFKQLGPRVIKF